MLWQASTVNCQQSTVNSQQSTIHLVSSHLPCLYQISLWCGASAGGQQSTVNSQQRGHGRRQKRKGDPAVPKPCRRLRSSTYQRFLVDSIMDKTPSILSSFPDDLVFFKSRVTTKLTNRCVTATGNVNVNVNALCFVGESYQSTSLPVFQSRNCILAAKYSTSDEAVNCMSGKSTT